MKNYLTYGVSEKSSVYILFFIFALMCFFWILYPSAENAVVFSAFDDALYYPKVAYNIITYGFVTYDGITPTNGFHPLWLILILPISFVFSNPITGLKAAYFLIAAVMIYCFWLYAKIAKSIQFTLSGLFLGFFILFLNFRSFILFFSLIESHLALLLLLLYISFCLKYGENRFSVTKLVFSNGLLIGLCFLARIDFLVLAIPFLLLLAAQKRNISSVKKIYLLLTAVSGMGVLVIPYLVYNYYSFGTVMTVSSWMKMLQTEHQTYFSVISSWLTEYITPRLSHITGFQELKPEMVSGIIILLLLTAAAALFLIMRNRELRSRLLQIKDFVAFSVLHLIFVFTAAPFDTLHSSWYLVPEILMLSFIFGIAAPDMKLKGVRIIPVFIFLILLLQFAYHPYYISKKTMATAKLEIAEILKAKTHKNERCMMFDSGIVAYFSERNFAAMNGLIGDFEMARLIKDKNYKEFVEKYKIKYLVADVRENTLNKYKDLFVFVTTTKSKYMNFSEGEKSFAVCRVTPENIDAILEAISTNK